MKKITFEDGVQTSGAKVNIAGTDYPVTPAEYEGNTPLSAYLLNKMQDYMQENIEDEVQTTITTEEAKGHTITDSAEVNGKIHITGGETKQDTTTGKNKVHYATGSTGLNGLTVTENSDGSVNISGTPSTNWANITPDLAETIASGNYIFSINQTFNFKVGLAVFTSGGTQTNFRITEGNKSIAVNLSSTQTKYRIFVENVNTSTTYNIQNLEIMLRPSNTDDTYEKYTGGIPAPNPNFPQDVVSVGSEGTIDFLVRNKNLFVNGEDIVTPRLFRC